MKKKKLLIILGSTLGVLLLAVLILPYLFKPTIKQAADKFIAENINADVKFPQDGLSIGMLRHFPNFTLALEDLSVVGRDEFKGDTLVNLKKFEVTVNIFALISSGRIEVNKIILDKPKLNVIVLPNGKANYDIYKAQPDTTKGVDTTKAEPVKFRLKELALKNADIIYSDQKSKMFASVKNLNITGSGDLAENVFDLSTKLTADKATVAMNGTEYLSNKSLDLNFVVNMDMNNNKYTFKDNSIKVNDFNFGFDGWVQLAQQNAIKMDVTFMALDNSFKGLLSLVPGVYTESFGDIKADGEFDFSGYAKGTMKDSLLPAFGVKLVTKNASFKYPKVPEAIKDINIDLNVDNKDGLIPSTAINLNKFSFKIGNNPFDGYLKVANLKNFPVDAKVNARLNLGELTSAFPIEGMTIKGIFDLALNAKGVYDDKTGAFPILAATAKLTNGFVQNKLLPTPLQNLNFVMTASNTTGKAENTVVQIGNFNMLLAGESLTATGSVQNIKDLAWNVKVAGGVDLEKIAKIFNLKDMTLKGKVKANLATSGKLSDVTAKRYANVKASGNMNVANFSYSSPDFKQGVTISTAAVVFNPASINLTKFESKVGSSQISATGSVTNYMGFLFKPDGVLGGNLNVNIPTFNANEWMTPADKEAVAKQQASQPSKKDSSVAVSMIPKNIDFDLKAHIGKFTYDNIVADNVNALVSISKGIMTIKDANMGIIGGLVNVKGTFDSDVKKPKFDLDLGIKSVSIPKAFETFETIQKYAPISQYVVGNMDLNYNLKGDLTKDMTPNVASLNGGGLVKILSGTLKDTKLTSLVAQFSKPATASAMTEIKELALSTTLEDGKLSVKPFDISMHGRKTTVSGYTSLDGKINYNLLMDVPANAVTTSLNSAMSRYLGKNAASGDMKVTLGVTGTYSKPSVKLVNVASASGKTVQSEVKEAVQDKVKQEATKEASKLLDKVIGGSKSDTAKKKAEDQLKDAAKKKLNDLFKRR
ncbi:AsmA family protein [Acetobacteroides hydrogenigenes]|uniref:AsmA-like protein n=1 Tax=Acetobacteroides hydrogenigenes TaxID=979970 RepID=A0A4R2E5Q8_9BACT|nr:AsmA-like C-terminal region-containing protein [Acetobacteroides hydrogenigenes]TCN62915.1 AsmA-like protein [Acetobacteroides hydrogenigenes]